MFAQKYGRGFPILRSLEQPHGKVKLVDIIGKGNYGSVYKGILGEDKVVAIKVVTMKYEELAETLLEMKILRDCQHENITKFFSGFADDTRLWICMEYCELGSLDHVYRNVSQLLNEEEIGCILYDTIQGLCYLHYRHNIIHRDVKAGNILIDGHGVCKLTDFGVSSKLRSLVSRTATFIGTPYWMAPEVISAGTGGGNARTPSTGYDYKVDVWSLGITAIEISQKKPPLSDLHPMRALELIPNVPIGLEKPKIWSKAFQAFVSLCLTKDPDSRPGTKELLDQPFVKGFRDANRKDVIRKLALHGVVKPGTEPRPRKGDQIVESCTDIGTTIVNTIATSNKAKEKAVHPSQKKKIHEIEQEGNFPLGDKIELIMHTPNPSTSLFKPIHLHDLSSINHINTVAAISADIVLIGSNTGLYFIVPSQTSNLGETVLNKPFPIIMKTKFVHISVMRQYNVLLALAGKKLRVRQYDLKNISNFVHYVIDRILDGSLSSSSVLSNVKINNQNPKLRLKNVVISSPFSSPSRALAGKGNLFRSSNPSPSFLLSDQELSDEDSSKLNPFYIKLSSTRNTSFFSVVKTPRTCFLVTVSSYRITVHEWAGEPYSKFMKLKGFWVPELPKFVDLVNDCVNVIEVVTLYNNDLTLIDFETGNVRAIPVPKVMLQKAQSGSRRWSIFTQTPFSEEHLKSLALVDSNTRNANLLRPEQFLQDLRNRANKNFNDLSCKVHFLGVCGDRAYILAPDGSLVNEGYPNAAWKDGLSFPEKILKIFFHKEPLSVVVVGKSRMHVVDWNTLKVLQSATFEDKASYQQQVTCTVAGAGSNYFAIHSKYRSTSQEIVLFHSEPPRKPPHEKRPSPSQAQRPTSPHDAPRDMMPNSPVLDLFPETQLQNKQREKQKPLVSTPNDSDRRKPQKAPQQKAQAYYFQPIAHNIINQNSKPSSSPYYVQQNPQAAAAVPAAFPAPKAPPRRPRPYAKSKNPSHSDINSIYSDQSPYSQQKKDSPESKNRAAP